MTQKIKYPLFITDYDGTLPRSDGSISEATRRAIARYVRDGGRFVVSTGRMPSGIVPQIRALGLHGLTACGQGSVILDVDSEECVFENRLSNETAIAVCRRMETMGLHIHVYDLWEYYSNADDAALAEYQRATRCKAVVVSQKISDFVAERRLQPYKILAIVPPSENEAVQKILTEMQLPECFVTRSGASLVEVGSVKNSKGTAAAFLAEYYGVPLERTIAVGDQCNDLPMLERVGLGFAVKNADPVLSGRARAIEYANDEDAVKEIIERFAYGEEK